MALTSHDIGRQHGIIALFCSFAFVSELFLRTYWMKNRLRMGNEKGKRGKQGNRETGQGNLISYHLSKPAFR